MWWTGQGFHTWSSDDRSTTLSLGRAASFVFPCSTSTEMTLWFSLVFLCRLPPHHFLTRRKRLWVTSALPWTPLSTGFGGDRTASTSFCSKNIVMRENQDQFYLFMARSPPHLERKLNNIFISSFCRRKSRYLNYYHIHDLSNENFHLKKGKQSHQVPILPFF